MAMLSWSGRLGPEPDLGDAHVPRKSWDRVTLFSLSVALGMVIGAILIGGSPGRFISGPALLVTLIGTAAVTAAGFSAEDLMRLPQILKQALVREQLHAPRVAAEMIRLALVTRKRGPLHLEDQAHLYAGINPFLSLGLRLIADGADRALLQRQMQAEIDQLVASRARAVQILRRAAEIAPAMGLIGTLIGLVQLMAAAAEPSAVAPAMGIALLTTLYGALLGTILIGPLAAKLARTTEEEVLIRRLYLTALDSIAAKDHPRLLEDALNALLPPDRRLAVFAP